MNPVIADIKNIIKAHDLTDFIHDKKSKTLVIIDPEQVARYLYGLGYRVVRVRKISDRG